MSEIWDDEDMDAAIAACNLDDGSKERVKALLNAVRDGYESFISDLSAQNAALFDRAAKRLAYIKELQAEIAKQNYDPEANHPTEDSYYVDTEYRAAVADWHAARDAWDAETK